MPEEPSIMDPKQLWQSQTEEETNVTLQFVRFKAQEFQSRINRRNMREYIASAVGILVVGALMFLLPDPVQKAGAALLLAGAIFVVIDLRRRGSARQLPPGGSAASCIEFHRAELIRQRDLLRRVVTVHLPVQIPGMITLLTGAFLQGDNGVPLATLGAIVLAVVLVGLAGYLNWRAAQKLDDELRMLAD